MVKKVRKPTNRAVMLKGFVEEGVKLNQEIKDAIDAHVAPIRELLRDHFAVVKGNGFEVKAVRALIKEKMMEYELKAELMAYREMLDGDPDEYSQE